MEVISSLTVEVSQSTALIFNQVLYFQFRREIYKH